MRTTKFRSASWPASVGKRRRWIWKRVVTLVQVREFALVVSVFFFKGGWSGVGSRWIAILEISRESLKKKKWNSTNWERKLRKPSQSPGRMKGPGMVGDCKLIMSHAFLAVRFSIGICGHIERRHLASSRREFAKCSVCQKGNAVRDLRALGLLCSMPPYFFLIFLELI